MIVDKGKVKKIDIMIMDEAWGEAYILRAFLERLGAEVRVNYIGNVKYLISIMSDKNYLHEILVICCHSEKEGIFLKELSKDLEKDMPFNKLLKSEDLASFLKLNNQLVINTGCCQGDEAFAKVFVEKGAKFYMGPEGFIEASSCILFLINFFYHYLAKNQSVSNSFDLASKIDEETGLFKYYDSQKLF